jgi:ABC-type maltose transport system permease subunit
VITAAVWPGGLRDGALPGWIEEHRSTYIDAARVDGASRWQLFLYVIFL